VDVPVVASGDIVSHARAVEVLETTGAAAVMVGRAAQGNPWKVHEILDGAEVLPSRADVVAELILFVRETARELGERRAASFLKKFYGWYLRRGGFPKPFVQELVRLDSTEAVVERLLIAEPAATAALERLEAEVPDSEGTLVPLPISAYGGG
jgi:tRNA-dihydrouridine synthase B